MSRDERLYIKDIHECCQRILDYSKALDYGKFCKDQRTVDAILHNLLVIGEATKNLALRFLEKHPAIPWKKIKGLRDIIAHQYFGIDYPLIWDITINKIPQLEKILNTEVLSQELH